MFVHTYQKRSRKFDFIIFLFATLLSQFRELLLLCCLIFNEPSTTYKNKIMILSQGSLLSELAYDKFWFWRYGSQLVLQTILFGCTKPNAILVSLSRAIKFYRVFKCKLTCLIVRKGCNSKGSWMSGQEVDFQSIYNKT